MSLSKRIGVNGEQAERLNGDELSLGSDVLFAKAFELGPSDPEGASIMLGCALLAKAHETKDGRLKASLLLLARLVAKADSKKTLGPKGAAQRAELLPTGWKELSSSWQRLRYAWREGLVDLLDVPEQEEATVEALDELTRMHPTEPEPVAVNIQEVFPSPYISFGVSALGLILSLRLMWKDWKRR